MKTFLAFLREFHFSGSSHEASLLLSQDGDIRIPITPDLVDLMEKRHEMGGFHICSVRGLIKLQQLENQSRKPVSVSVSPTYSKIAPGITGENGGILCFIKGRALFHLPFDAYTTVEKETGERWMNLTRVSASLPKHGLSKYQPSVDKILKQIKELRLNLAEEMASVFKDRFVEWDAVVQAAPDVANIPFTKMRDALPAKFNGKFIRYKSIPEYKTVGDAYWMYFARPFVRTQTGDKGEHWVDMVKWLVPKLNGQIEDVMIDNAEELMKLFFSAEGQIKPGQHDEASLVDFAIDGRILLVGAAVQKEYEAAKKNGTLDSKFHVAARMDKVVPSYHGGITKYLNMMMSGR